MNQLPHDYLKCNDYLKEQISITFLVRDRIQYVKLSMRDGDEIRTWTEKVMSIETVRESIECAEYGLLHER